MSDVFDSTEKVNLFSKVLSTNEYIFFYDETNNFRKLYLHENYRDKFYLNSNANPFVLGGLVFKKNIHNLDEISNNLKLLFKNLNYQKTQKEFKFKHIAKGNLEHVLKSNKLISYFEWIIQNNISIHVQILDVIFWSIIDIVESKTAARIYYAKMPIDIDFGAYPLAFLKSFLYDLVQKNKIEFFSKLHELGYPEINSENRFKFINFLKELSSKYENDKSNKMLRNPLNRMVLGVFKEILEEFVNQENDGFVFLKDEPKHKIINEMNVFYQNRIDSFPNSYHIFDHEYQVEAEIDKIWYNRDCKNYIFKESSKDIFIQLSDVVIGFFRILFEFLIVIDFESINEFVDKLNENQKICLNLFFDIYDSSVEETEYFIHYITPMLIKEKFEILYDSIKKAP